MLKTKQKKNTNKRPKKKSKPKILITGISGNLGRLLTKRLHRVASIHGVDLRPFVGCPKDVTLHRIDLRKKRCENLFRRHRYDAVFHLGIVHDPRRSEEEHHSLNLGGTSKILEYAQKYHVKKMILLSSATIYGPDPLNHQFLTEDSPLNAALHFPQIRDLIELDMLAQSFFWKHMEIETVILRPVHIVGPHMKNGFSKYLQLSVIPRVFGFDPMIQLIDEEDVVEALILALKPDIRGIFNITGPASVPLSELIKATGRRSISLPHFAIRAIIKRLWHLKLATFRPEESDYARYMCTVDGSRAKSLLGYEAKHSIRQTLRSLVTD